VQPSKTHLVIKCGAAPPPASDNSAKQTNTSNIEKNHLGKKTK